MEFLITKSFVQSIDDQKNIKLQSESENGKQNMMEENTLIVLRIELYDQKDNLKSDCDESEVA